MNGRGQVIFLAFMLGVSFFAIGLAIAPAIVSSVVDARSVASCSSATDISVKIFCSLVDIIAPYVIATIMGLAGMIVGGRIAR